MRPTARLLQHSCRVTFFTKWNCGLCHTAKEVLQHVQKQKAFEYVEKDISLPENERWGIYGFDVPVIHVEKASTPQGQIPPASQKLMHRLDQQQVVQLLDDVEKMS